MTREDNPLTIRLREVLSTFPKIHLAVLFGSMANGTGTFESDLDLAVKADRPLTSDQRISMTEALAMAFDRPVDLIDLHTVGQPLLYEILSGGKQVLGPRHLWGELVYRSIMENEDFVPYQKRILEGHRRAWLNKSMPTDS